MSWHRIFAGATIAAVSAASLAPSIAINAAHALNSGGHLPLLILAVMSVIAAPICLAALPVLLSRCRFDLAAGAGLLFCCSLAFNLTNAIGLAGGERDQQREDRGGQIDKVSSTKQRLSETSAAFAHARTVSRGDTPAMVQAEIVGLKADPLFKRSGECTNVTVTESKNHCQKYADALVREAAAREVVRLDRETRDLRDKLDGLGEAPTSEDPKVDRIQAIISLMIPVTNEGGHWVGIALDANVALLVELLGTFLPPIVGVLIWPARREAPAATAMPTGLEVAAVAKPPLLAAPAEPSAPAEQPAPALQEAPEVKAKPKPRATKPPAEPAEAAPDINAIPPSVRMFAERCLVRRKGAKVQSKDLFAAYQADCHNIGLKPENLKSFGLAMAAMGWQKESKRVISYIDMALKTSRPTLVAVG